MAIAKEYVNLKRLIPFAQVHIKLRNNT